MSPRPRKLRIAVICGGTSSEREVSIRSGKNVFKSLDHQRFIPSFVEITKEGLWIVRQTALNKKRNQKLILGPSAGIRRNEQKIGTYADVVFLALHGTFGEDGRVQALMEIEGIPFTGSGVLASALAMDKYKTLQFLDRFQVHVPKTIAVTRDQFFGNKRKTLLRIKFKYPCVVKPNASGSSVGVSIVRSRKALEQALTKALKEDHVALVEEYVKGREVTCGVMGNASIGEPAVALPPVEIISDGVFFDYRAKYHSKKTQEICPAPLTPQQTKMVTSLAAKVHILLGCDGLTRSDFILAGKRLFFLETNTLPGLTEQSLCPKEAAAVGMSLTEFFSAQIDMALWKFRN